MVYTLVLDDDGRPKFNEDNLPLFTQPGGTQFPLDLDKLYDAVRRKNGEAAFNRKEKEALAAKLAAFEGIDPEFAGKADDLVREKEGLIRDLMVRNAFAESSFLREKTVLTPDFAYAGLNRHFSVEYKNDMPVLIARDGNGNPLLSEEDPSTHASAEEAIRLLIQTHPQRDSLLRSVSPNGGSGTTPGSGGRISAPRLIRRNDFEALSPQDKALRLKDGWNVVD